MPGPETNRILQGNPNLIVTDPGIRPLALNAAFDHMRVLYRIVKLGPTNYKDALIVVSAPSTRAETRTVLRAAANTATSLDEIQEAVARVKRWTKEDDDKFTADHKRLTSNLRHVTLYDVSLDQINKL